jgi:DNA-directed RNA polymerase subunit RPC12/RpoP
MALITCHECGNQVSTEAIVCPKCGAPGKRIVTKQQNNNSIAIQIIAGMSCAIFGVIIGINNFPAVGIFLFFAGSLIYTSGKIREWFHK